MASVEFLSLLKISQIFMIDSDNEKGVSTLNASTHPELTERLGFFSCYIIILLSWGEALRKIGAGVTFFVLLGFLG